MTERHKSNLLVNACPRVAKEWHPTKNTEMSLSTITKGSPKKVWWLCSKNTTKSLHEWRATVKDRVGKGSKCPYCSGRVATPGVNDLKSMYPEIAKEWSDRNQNTPSDVPAKGTKKVWWVCEKGHEWEVEIRKRTVRGYGCPFCANKRVLPGFNDLATKRPDLLSYWDFEKNTLNPTEVTVGSYKKIHWICEKSHTWTSSGAVRQHADGCPYCVGNRLWTGFNDLQTINPSLVLEWDFEKNAHITPDKVTRSSSTPAWWTCSKGHSWKALVSDRTDGHGCPQCIHRISSPEVNIASILQDISIVFETQKRSHGGFIDIFLPSLNLALEYDGWYWHKDLIEKDTEKTLMLLDKGYNVVRIREVTRGESLEFLPISHPKLLQLPWKYRKDSLGLDAVVNEILLWAGVK